VGWLRLNARRKQVKATPALLAPNRWELIVLDVVDLGAAIAFVGRPGLIRSSGYSGVKIQFLVRYLLNMKSAVLTSLPNRPNNSGSSR